MGKKHSIYRSFGYAWEGLKQCFKYEPNFRIHIFFAICAIAMGWFLVIEPVEWLMLAMTIFLVIILELLNTVLEAIVDLVSPQVLPAAKKAKDVSAAMVLLSAIFSVVVGIILFLPKIIFLYQ